MRHFAVVGSGPAGFYTAEALEKAYGEHGRIDIIDRYPVPYGLIRFGVAPDHQSLKAVSKRYDKVAESAGVDFIGNVTGRRGPHQVAMTPKELGELGHLEAAVPVVDPADFPPVEADEPLDPGLRKSVSLLRGFASLEANKPKQIIFDFFAKPFAIEGDGKAERIIVERTELDERGAARGTGETYAVPASLIVTAIGYSTPPMDGVAHDERGGKFLNDSGRVADRLYAVGWARRGPTGTIGTNRPDGYEVADQVAAALPPGTTSDRAGALGLKR